MKVKIPVFLLVIVFFLSHCNALKSVRHFKVFGLTAADTNSSPVYSAKEAIKRMQVEEGFEVKVVASEPLLNAPVAMSFDSKGRIWLVEMTGYMPDTLGTGEEVPNGKVVILEDKNHDGLFDSRKVFLDSLVLPRAICLIENGILVAESPNLWYYEIVNDKPVNKVLVDSKYAEGGNVEHQPNGLLRAMDNWIYNAKSDKRYRKNGKEWLIEHTHFRGQWGISQDNYGRLFYNTNSQNLIADYFTPGVGATNKDQHHVAGFNEDIVGNNKVYPARPTPGVNRGYMEGTLDDSLRLVNFTAACGPLVYRGEAFGKSFESSVFVAEPSANLIKQNVLIEDGTDYVIKGKQAYKGKEFLSSIDERFRPVSLYDAPDGALYIVDFYRGIIQHKTYLTPYLMKQIGKRGLTQPLAFGRIYKVVPKGKKLKNTILPDDPKKLVAFLGHPNGWVRDQAQQMLVDRKADEIIPRLRQAIKETDKPLLVMHAMWTLEGLHALKTDEVLTLLQQPSWAIRMQALSVLPSVIDKTNLRQYVAALEQSLTKDDASSAPYVAFAAYKIKAIDLAAAEDLLLKTAQKYPGDKYVADAVIAGLQNREEIFLKKLMTVVPDTNKVIRKRLASTIAENMKKRANRDPQVLAKQFPKGAVLFNTVCQACHGADGNGISSLAPPLNQSEWVNGDQDKLISIVLFGLTGPVAVNGHVYKAPEINGEMPGIGANKDISDDEVAQILSFIRKSWLNNADKVSVDDVVKIRNKYAGRQGAFNIKELN